MCSAYPGNKPYYMSYLRTSRYLIFLKTNTNNNNNEKNFISTREMYSLCKLCLQTCNLKKNCSYYKILFTVLEVLIFSSLPPNLQAKLNTDLASILVVSQINLPPHLHWIHARTFFKIATIVNKKMWNPEILPITYLWLVLIGQML